MFKNGTDTAAVGICPVFYLWIRKWREDISLYFFGIDFQQVLTGQIQSICYTKSNERKEKVYEKKPVFVDYYSLL